MNHRYLFEQSPKMPWWERTLIEVLVIAGWELGKLLIGMLP